MNIFQKGITYLTLLATLTSFTGCGPEKEPQREDYKNHSVAMDYGNGRIWLRDMNEDSFVDAIWSDRGDYFIYIDTLQIPNFSKRKSSISNQMTPELVESATNARDAILDLRFRMDKEEYDREVQNDK